MPEKDEILRGWKEIENLLRMTRRTIIACGYPVRRERHTNGSMGSVYAFRDELLKFARSPHKRDKAAYSRNLPKNAIQDQHFLPL